jgi:hypothetical protein
VTAKYESMENRLDKSLAHQQAEKIERHWREQGFANVRASVVEEMVVVKNRSSGSTDYKKNWRITSNLVNGYPPPAPPPAERPGR